METNTDRVEDTQKDLEMEPPLTQHETKEDEEREADADSLQEHYLEEQPPTLEWQPAVEMSAQVMYIDEEPPWLEPIQKDDEEREADADSLQEQVMLQVESSPDTPPGASRALYLEQQPRILYDTQEPYLEQQPRILYKATHEPYLEQQPRILYDTQEPYLEQPPRILYEATHEPYLEQPPRILYEAMHEPLYEEPPQLVPVRKLEDIPLQQIKKIEEYPVIKQKAPEEPVIPVPPLAGASRARYLEQPPRILYEATQEPHILERPQLIQAKRELHILERPQLIQAKRELYLEEPPRILYEATQEPYVYEAMQEPLYEEPPQLEPVRKVEDIPLQQIKKPPLKLGEERVAVIEQKPPHIVGERRVAVIEQKPPHILGEERVAVIEQKPPHILGEERVAVIEQTSLPQRATVVDRQTGFQDNEAGRKHKAKEAEEVKFEDQLGKTLADGDIDDISDVISPYGLGNCRTNCLEKAMQVSSRLYQYAQQKGPSAEEFRKLAESAQEFAVQLIEPLKGDDMKRAIFGGDFDRIADQAVQCEQKKLVSHPVVYSLLMQRWIGDFWRIMHAPFPSCDWLIWVLINIWVPLDLVLFPAVFALLFIIHLVVGLFKRRRDTRIVFLLNASGKFQYDTFEIMRHVALATAKIYKYGRQVHFSCFLETGDFSSVKKELTMTGLRTWRFMNEDQADSQITLPEMIPPTPSQDDQQDSGKKRLDHPDHVTSALKCAIEVLSKEHSHTNKALVILTDSKFGASKRDLMEATAALSRHHVTTVPVGIGVYPDIQELETMATHPEDLILRPDNVDDKDVAARLRDSVYGRDCFDRYIKYFTTPCFVFMRDTCSYLVLLALHFAVCLQPSSRQFTATEWCILVFFLGRFMMEVHQLTTSPSSQQNSRYKSRRSSNRRQRVKPSNQLRRYINDRWNVLDVVTLISYVILFILRVITWSTHGQVSQNRLLAVAGYLYGLNSMLLTLRVFGHIMESKKSTGAIQIALFQIIGAVVAIFGQFLAATIAFSLAITKIYMVEMSYTAATNATSHGFCSTPGVDCWWGAAQHLVWSLLGIADVGPLTSSDAFSESLAKLLYGLFLIMGVVMLMNMMIALLSNTYQRVEDNSFYEWSYKKAITIRTYCGYYPVPVPFNIIPLTAMMLRYIYRALRGLCHCACATRKRGQGQQEKLLGHKTENAAAKSQKTNIQPIFDRLCKDLKAIYESRFGYSFPLTDEGKIDRVVKETDGSHQLVGHIANRVFREDWAEREQGFPTGEKAWDYIGLRVNGNQITYLGPGHCSKCAVKRDTHHGATYVQPLTKEFPGFEVLIQECGERRCIAVGLVSGNYDKHLFPGWESNTVGYHVDDGKIFDHRDPKFGRNEDNAMAYRGDLIGCVAEFDDRTDDILPVSFTLNGHVIGRASLQYSSFSKNEFYPYVAMAAHSISVIVKMCPTISTSHSTSTNSTRRESTSDDLDRLSRQVENLSQEIMQLRKEFGQTLSEVHEILARQSPPPGQAP